MLRKGAPWHALNDEALVLLGWCQFGFFAFVHIDFCCRSREASRLPLCGP